MKSRSALFPVSLLRAENWGDLNEDVYLLKHNRCADHSAEVALSRFSSTCGSSRTRPPVVLVHGSFSNRGFWLSAKGIGLAKHLLDEGFDVWLYDQRGHGLSPRNQAYHKNTLEQYVLADVSAISEFVQEQTGQKVSWLGHSLGGVIIASAVAANVLNDRNCRSLVLLGSQAVRRPWYLWLPLCGLFLRLIVSVKGELDGRQLKIGPENEPAGLVNEYLKRHDWFGRWQLMSTRQKLLPAWKKATLPLLSVAASADTSDPAKYCRRFFDMYGAESVSDSVANGVDKEYILLGKDQGFDKDYGHVDMVVSKEAVIEVWPKISRWLKKRYA